MRCLDSMNMLTKKGNVESATIDVNQAEKHPFSIKVKLNWV